MPYAASVYLYESMKLSSVRPLSSCITSLVLVHEA